MTETINADINDDTPPSWVPTGEMHQLPSDVTPLWTRLEELAALTWPTAAEQVERQLLVTWLKPGGDTVGIVKDAQAFEAMCDLFHYSPLGNMSMLRPVYDEASKVWASLCALAAGKALEPARYSASDYFDEQDHLAAEEGRLKQALEWWKFVMRVLDMLSRSGDIDAHELMAHVSNHEVLHAMRRHFVVPLFDGPMAIGASIYLEPGTPGMGLGIDGETIYAVHAHARAVNAELEALEKVPSREAYEAAVVRIDYLWQLLKGFVWAGTSSTGMRLSSLLARHDDVWNDTKHALVSGREVINAYIHSSEKPKGFGSRRGKRSEAVFNEPVSELIARMGKLIEAAKQEKLQNML